MLTEIETLQLPTWALPALINGDTSALTGAEEDQLECFLLNYESYEGLLFEVHGEPYFSWVNAVDNYGGDVNWVTIHGHKAEVTQ